MDGHELHEEDLRLMHTFDQSSGSAAQYEAHSDSQVCSTFKPSDIFYMLIEHHSRKKDQNKFFVFCEQM